MASVVAQLKELRQQVEKLQVEVAGRQSIGAMVVWDEQNESSVNQERNPNSGDFQGLVVHLTAELSPQAGTVSTDAGIAQNEFEALKADIVRSLARQTADAVD